MQNSTDLRAFYEEKHRHYGTAPAADNAHAKIVALVGSGRRVLDVGCGSGHLGAEMRALGNYVAGIELSTSAAAEARARLDEVVAGSIPDADSRFEPASFDVVVCADVLEHMFDAEGALLHLRRFLRPGGTFLISLPNVAHFTVRLDLLRGRWEYQEIGILDAGHVRFYTRATAERLLAAAGLAIVHREITTSVPHASPATRRVIDLCRRLPERLRERLGDLIAVQFVFVAELKA